MRVPKIQDGGSDPVARYEHGAPRPSEGNHDPDSADLGTGGRRGRVMILPQELWYSISVFVKGTHRPSIRARSFADKRRSDGPKSIR